MRVEFRLVCGGGGKGRKRNGYGVGWEMGGGGEEEMDRG